MLMGWRKPQSRRTIPRNTGAEADARPSNALQRTPPLLDEVRDGLKSYRLGLEPARALDLLKSTIVGERGPFADFRPVSWDWSGALSSFRFDEVAANEFILRPNEEGDPAANARLALRGRLHARDYGSELELEFEDEPSALRWFRSERIRIFGLSFVTLGVTLVSLALLMGFPLVELSIRLASQLIGTFAILGGIQSFRALRAKRLQRADLLDMLARIEGTLGPLELASDTDLDPKAGGGYRRALPTGRAETPNEA